MVSETMEKAVLKGAFLRRAAGADARARSRNTRVSIVGCCCLAIVLFVTIFGPLIITADPNAVNPTNAFAPPSAEAWLGTDQLGRDFAARLVHGGRVTLLIAVITVGLASVVAIVIGVGMAAAGGAVDLVGSRVVDLFFAIPSLLLAIGVVAILGPSIGTTILALAIAYWASYARLIRSETILAMSRPHLDMSRMNGAGRLRILRLDVLPSLRGLLVVQTTALLGFAVLDEAGLGFLGLGIQPPQPSWGALLSESREVILTHPEYALIAGVPVLLTVLGLNLVADSLSDRDLEEARR